MPHMMTRRTAADGTETWMELIRKGVLRNAMEATKHRTDGGPDCSSIPKLALAAGVSTAAIGFLVTDGKSGRSTCSVTMANKIADALGWDVNDLFFERTLAKAS